MSRIELIYEWQGPLGAPVELRETFEGTYEELQKYVRYMKGNGCFNIRMIDRMEE